ncbi:hypothetical protein [Acinetobacter calcoaceticus]|uniref:hypothetical protein n=1 Tax=Acinetobacter calcoaceticus TaxID=471 RepID=UPI001E31696F|nr:hypothetical protein [Acinetobacter calcoaceticus]UGQ30116.1 hypothetical protein LRO84_01245 [Acinetobacter calcoaceticus]
MIHSKIIGISVITGLCSMAALAEPAVQPGDTLESLSKVKVTTTVNGQPGSISDLVNSGQVQQVSAAPTNAAPTGAPIPADVPPAPPAGGEMAPPAPIDAVPPAQDQASPAPQDPNAAPPAADSTQSADPMAKDGALPADAPIQAQ